MDESFQETLRRVNALRPEQHRWLAGELEARLGADDTAQRASRRLVGYFAPSGDSPPSTEEVRAYLAERLPDYMVPSQLVELEALPRSDGGKLDRKALPTVRASESVASIRESVSPRNATEATLVRIWQDALGAEGVSVYDDFMEIGGDSLLSIRVLARARREGIEIAPEIFFEKPTIAALAAHVAPAAASVTERGDPLVELGEAPLTPIQWWFFENIPDHPHHWNQSSLLVVPEDFDMALLRRIADELLSRHDALRVTFPEESGRRRQVFRPRGEETPVRCVAISDEEDDARLATIAETAAQVQSGFDLAAGPLVFFVLFDPGVGREKRLLTVAHHLIVDPVSWSLLIGDLDDLYRRHREGQALTLPPPTACFGVYASRLEQRATDFSADADFWLQTPDSRDAAIPVDHPVEDRSNVAGSARTLSVAIDPVTSGILLRDVPSRAAVRGHEVLLAALLQAWADWSGSSRMLFDLEGHGRDTLADELDIASSVGWFTAVFPVVLNRDEADSDRLLQSVRRQLRAVQSRGVGHGVLRWLGRTPEIAAALAEKHRPELLFNFLGRIDTLVGADSFLRVSDEPHGPDRHPEGRRAYLIEINSYVEHDTLRFNIEYHPAVHDAASIELLADRLTRELHAFAEEPDARDSPDLGLSGLDAAGLETVARLLSRNDK